jgi:hypothetical protein
MAAISDFGTSEVEPSGYATTLKVRYFWVEKTMKYARVLIFIG